MYASLGVVPDDFWRGEHRRIWIASSQVFEAGQSPDPVLVKQKGGDASTIGRCMDNSVRMRDDNARHMVKSLKELARARSIYYASQNVLRKFCQPVRHARKAALKGIKIF